MSFAIAGEMQVQDLVLDSDEAQFYLDWIVSIGGYEACERLDGWLSGEAWADDPPPFCVEQLTDRSGEYLMGDYPIIHEDWLAEMLKKNWAELMDALGIPRPTEEQRKRKMFPSGYMVSGVATNYAPGRPMSGDMIDVITGGSPIMRLSARFLKKVEEEQK